jgi:predicted AAA+ superfamily ATPase
MQFIYRFYQDLDAYLKKGEILVIYDPHQVGKTTLLKHFLDNSSYTTKCDIGDNIETQALFYETNIKKLTAYTENFELLIIDEAQKLPYVGQNLKIIVDHCPNLKIVVTGSSSFELAGQVGEPLTGRKRTLTLYPLAQLELQHHNTNLRELRDNLADYIIYGCYPKVIMQGKGKSHEKIRIVDEIMQSYMLKDVLSLDRIKNAKPILQLLQLLAHQIGSEVSHHELGQQIGLDTKAVSRYLNLFEKSFVIYNLRGFSRNLRKEITKKSKYYFYDTGIRNALVSNFQSLGVRSKSDLGGLWENFLFMERLKRHSYKEDYASLYFWRTWDSQEIDLIEDKDGSLHAYEFKWQSKKKKISPPKTYLKNYPKSTFQVIDWYNYLDFVL